MKWSLFFTSAVGRKFVMALTGLFLISFLIVHVGLNCCIFYDLPIFDANDNGRMFNLAAHFMGSSLVPRLLEIGLMLGIILHIVQGYMIEASNRARRKQGYQVSLGSRGSTWMSRSMAILGTLVFLYLVMHIAQFWVPSRISHTLAEANYDGKPVHDLYGRMFETFQNKWVVLLYLVGVAALAFHLFHGFHSAFRSLGIHNRKYLALAKSVGYGFTIIVSVLFALMPISMFLHWVNPY